MKKLALFLGMSAALVAHETKGQTQGNFIEKVMSLGAPNEDHICAGFLDNKKDTIIISVNYKTDPKTGKKTPVSLATYLPGQKNPEIETNSFGLPEDNSEMFKSNYGIDINDNKKNKFFPMPCPKNDP